MSKVISVVAFVLLSATGAVLFACGDSPNNPPPQTPTTSGTGTAPASSSATPQAPAPQKGGW